jgi:hypothetical protein
MHLVKGHHCCPNFLVLANQKRGKIRPNLKNGHL